MLSFCSVTNSGLFWLCNKDEIARFYVAFLQKIFKYKLTPVEWQKENLLKVLYFFVLKSVFITKKSLHWVKSCEKYSNISIDLSRPTPGRSLQPVSPEVASHINVFC